MVVDYVTVPDSGGKNVGDNMMTLCWECFTTNTDPVRVPIPLGSIEFQAHIDTI